MRVLQGVLWGYMRIEQGFVQGLSSDSTGFSSSGSGKLPVAIPRFERFWLSAMRAR